MSAFRHHANLREALMKSIYIHKHIYTYNVHREYRYEKHCNNLFFISVFFPSTYCIRYFFSSPGHSHFLTKIFPQNTHKRLVLVWEVDVGLGGTSVRMGIKYFFTCVVGQHSNLASVRPIKKNAINISESIRLSFIINYFLLKFSLFQTLY